MSGAQGLFADAGWRNSPQDSEFASQGAFRFREMKDELWKLLGCFLKPDFKGELRDGIITSDSLADTGVVAGGPYNKFTVNSKGQIVTAELTDPLGDPIHSPGPEGYPDCPDNLLPPEDEAKGFTRVRIDEFGRVIKGDCVDPHVSDTAEDFDGGKVDKHGRIEEFSYDNIKGRVQSLELGAGGNGAGGYINFDKEELVNVSTLSATTGYVDLVFPSGVPNNATAVYLSVRLGGFGDDPKGYIEIKDSRGEEFICAQCNGFTLVIGSQAQDTATVFIDVSGPDPVQWRFVRQFDSGGTTYTAIIEQWGWSIPIANVGTLETTDVEVATDALAVRINSTVNLAHSLLLADALRFEGNAVAMYRPAANGFPAWCKYTFAKILGVWHWSIIAFGDTATAGPCGSAAVSGTGTVADSGDFEIDTPSGVARFRVTLTDNNVEVFFDTKGDSINHSLEATLEAYQAPIQPSSGVRAAVSFNGFTGAINGQSNVASVVKTTTGQYTVTFDQPLPDANYSASVSCDGPYPSAHNIPYIANKTASSFRVEVWGITDAGNPGLKRDVAYIDCIVAT